MELESFRVGGEFKEKEWRSAKMDYPYQRCCHSFIAWSLSTAACTHLAKEVHHPHLYRTRFGPDMISHRIQNYSLDLPKGLLGVILQCWTSCVYEDLDVDSKHLSHPVDSAGDWMTNPENRMYLKIFSIKSTLKISSSGRTCDAYEV